MTFVVCPVCKNGRATLVGWTLICPAGHRFKLRLVKRKNG
jgi:uncharacterized protein YbaR (Trm112 family)